MKNTFFINSLNQIHHKLIVPPVGLSDVVIFEFSYFKYFFDIFRKPKKVLVTLNRKDKQTMFVKSNIGNLHGEVKVGDEIEVRLYHNKSIGIIIEIHTPIDKDKFEDSNAYLGISQRLKHIYKYNFKGYEHKKIKENVQTKV